MSLSKEQKTLLEEYSSLSEDELLYELDQSHAYVDAGYSSSYHTQRIADLMFVLSVRETNTPVDDCTHWVGHLPKKDEDNA